MEWLVATGIRKPFSLHTSLSFIHALSSSHVHCYIVSELQANPATLMCVRFLPRNQKNLEFTLQILAQYQQYQLTVPVSICRTSFCVPPVSSTLCKEEKQSLKILFTVPKAWAIISCECSEMTLLLRALHSITYAFGAIQWYFVSLHCGSINAHKVFIVWIHSFHLHQSKRGDVQYEILSMMPGATQSLL